MNEYVGDAIATVTGQIQGHMGSVISNLAVRLKGH